MRDCLLPWCGTDMGFAWLLLFIGIAFEVAGTTGMRALAASAPAWSLASATVGIVISYFFASRAMETIPVGLAYAVWSGVGLAGISLLSWLLFAEAMPPLKLFGLALVTAGMVTINLSKPPPQGACNAASASTAVTPGPEEMSRDRLD